VILSEPESESKTESERNETIADIPVGNSVDVATDTFGLLSESHVVESWYHC